MAEVTLRAEFAAVVIQISVSPGQQVQVDQELFVLESMKTEIPVAAPFSGRVSTVHVQDGQAVDEGQPLVTLES